MSELAGKRIVITGAASGIGRASSLLAAQQGAAIIAVDNAESVQATVAEIVASGGNAIAVQADISVESEVEAFVARCIEEFGGIDGLYANAGILGANKPLQRLTAKDWQRTLGVNTVGTFLCIQQAAARMVPQGRGAIVCTASVAGLRANAGGIEYSASTAAVISMAQTVAYELYGSGVRINAICPGLIETGMTAHVFERVRAKGKESLIGQVNPAARAGAAEEIASMACFLLSDAASYINGQAIAVDGGLSASHPWVYPQSK
jgi:NAD(P)-dependent dehydrogenase (short-subunit alcohol dehydrogenase family)